jgi:hypothetical protein
MADEHAAVLQALSVLPRWHVVHWGTRETSTLLCLWVSGRETLVPVDGSSVTYRGVRTAIDDGQLAALLRRIQREQDLAALATPDATAARQWLVDNWQRDGDDGAMGIWEFPRGGFLRWIHNGMLHVETGEGGPYDQPMPEPLREVLVDLGWNPPDRNYRNCWLQPSENGLEEAASLGVLTPLAAFGFDAPPAWS